jgi:hypothetical protein
MRNRDRNACPGSRTRHRSRIGGFWRWSQHGVLLGLVGGAQVSRELADQATGRNVTVTFPAGPVIEYVQWDDETRAAAGL